MVGYDRAPVPFWNRKTSPNFWFCVRAHFERNPFDSDLAKPTVRDKSPENVEDV